MAYKYPVEKIPEIKILILYIAEQTKSVCKRESFDRLWMTDFVMLNIKTDYFMFQSVLGDLIDEGYLIKEERDGKEMLSITKLGRDTVGYFYTELPQSVRVTVDKELIRSVKEQKTKDAVNATYVKVNEKIYFASLRLSENEEPLLGLDVTMPDEKSARELSKAMKKEPGLLYRRVIEACNEILEKNKK